MHMKYLNYHDLDPKFISDELKKGKIFIVPTDTCYGIISKISSETIERIYKIKQRPRDKFMPIFIRKEWANDYIQLNQMGQKILDKFWPGALSIVGKVKKDKLGFLSPVLSLNNTVSVREPNYDLILRILNNFSEPLTATSANISGQSSCYNKTELLNQFGQRENQPDYILDAHSLPKRKSSTIIDIETLEILRDGEIPKNAIAKFINS